MTVKLGPIEVENPFILAPMAGITDSPFRRLMRRRGCGLVVSELVSANGLFYSGDKSKDLLRFTIEERPIGLQVFGENIDRMRSACEYVEQLGADFVDLNMGCPVPKVVKKGAGSALCRDLVRLSELLKTIKKSVKIPVTIKIRSGWDKDSINALEVSRVAQDCGIAWVCIHGRTRSQGYSGKADWELIGNVKAKVSIPVIGNGDVITAADAIEKLKTYKVDAVMIGRGALKNPFIFEEASTGVMVGREGFLDLIDEHVFLLKETYSEHMALVQARKFIAWYSSGLPGCHSFRKVVFELPELEELRNRAKEFFFETFSSKQSIEGNQTSS